MTTRATMSNNADASFRLTTPSTEPRSTHSRSPCVPSGRVLDLGAGTGLLAVERAALTPGGVFVNAEQVSARTILIDDRYAAWHERRATEAGSSAEEWAGALGADTLQQRGLVVHAIQL